MNLSTGKVSNKYIFLNTSGKSRSRRRKLGSVDFASETEWLEVDVFVSYVKNRKGKLTTKAEGF